MIKLEISCSEYELLKKAVSYLKSNTNDAEDFFDEIISDMKLEELEKYIYNIKNDGIKNENN